MTPSQCRAARSLVDLTQPRLADAASLGLSTVVDFERSRRTVSADAIDAMRTALEAAGVEFIPENGGGPGVRLKKRAGGDAGAKPVGPATDAVDAMDAAISKDRTRPDNARLASVKETGEEVPQEEWERFEAADKKPKRKS